MNRDKIKSITKQRLHSWGELMIENHATPMLALGVGHDHNSGQVRVFVTEDRSKEEIVALLTVALKQLVQ